MTKRKLLGRRKEKIQGGGEMKEEEWRWMEEERAQQSEEIT